MYCTISLSSQFSVIGIRLGGVDLNSVVLGSIVLSSSQDSLIEGSNGYKDLYNVGLVDKTLDCEVGARSGVDCKFPRCNVPAGLIAVDGEILDMSGNRCCSCFKSAFYHHFIMM